MNSSEHKTVHVKLHDSLDQLLADFIMHTEKFLSETTLTELLYWSHRQTIDPTEQK